MKSTTPLAFEGLIGFGDLLKETEDVSNIVLLILFSKGIREKREKEAEESMKKLAGGLFHSLLTRRLKRVIVLSL